MVDYFLDERTQDHLTEMRRYRREANEERFVPPLLQSIASCKASGTGFKDAIELWLASLDGRIGNDIRRLKIPHVLREVLGLSTQNVILENGCLWSAVDGGKSHLLYSPS